MQKEATQVKYLGLLVGVWIKRAPVRMRLISGMFFSLLKPSRVLVRTAERDPHKTATTLDGGTPCAGLRWKKKKDPGGIVRRFWMPPTPTLDFTCCFYEAHPGPRERWRDVYLSLLRYSHSSNSGEKCWLGKINKLKDCTTHQRRCRLKQTIKSSWRRDLLLAVGRCIGLEVW